MAIYLTSDTHFCHDKEFIYGPRGFSSAEEMSETIVKNWNSVVKPEDTVYHLGDVMLNDNDKGMEFLKRLNGNIYILAGNHDTPARIQRYYEAKNVVETGKYSDILKYKGYTFYLSHYPTVTGNYDDSQKSLKRLVINLYGHTHQKEKFYNDNPLMYCVCQDAHNCYPVNLDKIIEEIAAAR